MVAILFVGARTHKVWKEGTWELPPPAKSRGPSLSEETKKVLETPPFLNTKGIVDKNLFDPERGGGAAGGGLPNPAQRIQSMVLLGTAIIGDSRYAIFQPPIEFSSPAQRPQPAIGNFRLKLGDTYEGFRLSEIQDKKVIFSRGPSRVEIVLDFFRRVEEPMSRAGTPVRPPPTVIPRPPGGGSIIPPAGAR